MNPYETLGIPPSASLAQIKSAYRRRAMDTHPDRGNDGAEFALVARAYAVLSDPEMRRRYDETGSIDDEAVHSVHQRMVSALAAIFEGVMKGVAQAGVPIAQVDWIEQMRINVEQSLAKNRGALEAQRRALVDTKVLMQRITRKTDGQNLFADVLRSRLREIEPALRETDLTVRALERLSDELKHYKSEVEIVQAMQVMRWGAGACGQSPSSGSGQMFVWPT